MAKTIFDIMPVRPTRGPSFIGAEPEKKIPTQAEEGEPEVGADPRLGRAVFSYLEPRKGTDAPGDFRSCASCRNFVPERAFRAATRGNHCVLMGNWPIEAHASCNHYAPWPMGKPIEHVIDAHALACLNGARQSLDPYSANYDDNPRHSHKCSGCRHFDAVGDEDTHGPECELMEALNRSLPKVFDAGESIEADGGCSAWTEPAPDESNPSGQEGGL